MSVKDLSATEDQSVQLPYRFAREKKVLIEGKGKRLKIKNKVVEAVGIEPTSECIVQMASTCLGHY